MLAATSIKIAAGRDSGRKEEACRKEGSKAVMGRRLFLLTLTHSGAPSGWGAAVGGAGGRQSAMSMGRRWMGVTLQLTANPSGRHWQHLLLFIEAICSKQPAEQQLSKTWPEPKWELVHSAP